MEVSPLLFHSSDQIRGKALNGQFLQLKNCVGKEPLKKVIWYEEDGSDKNKYYNQNQHGNKE